MEQKKTLWIVAASGVFLLVVAGAALLLSLQKTGTAPAYENPADGWIYPSQATSQAQSPVYPSQPQFQDDSQKNPEGYVQPLAQTETSPSNPAQPDFAATGTEYATPTAPIGSESNYSESPINTRNVTVITDNALVYGTGTTTTIDLNTLKSNPVSVSPVATTATAPVSAATVTPVAPVSATPAETGKTYTTETVAATKTQKTSASTASKTSATTAPKATAKKTAQKTAAKTASSAPAQKAAPKATSYWIQVGSYEAKKSADEARTILENNKIPNEVFTYTDAKGKLFYRVRVGPYTTKSEAEYWQKRIASTDEFAKTGSYIVQN